MCAIVSTHRIAFYSNYRSKMYKIGIANRLFSNRHKLFQFQHFQNDIDSIIYCKYGLFRINPLFSVLTILRIQMKEKREH